MITYSRAERAAAADVADSCRGCTSLPANAGHPRAQHRDQTRGLLDPPPRGSFARRRPDPAGCRSGTCPAPPRCASSEKFAIRLDCSARTPSTKKLPSPTASRITRVWLPGRRRLMTACRSGNQRASASGRTARTQARACEVQHERDGCEADRDDRARLAAMPPARPRRQPAPTVTGKRRSHLRPVDRSPSAGDRAADASGDGSGRAWKRVEPPRISSSGLTRRTSSSGTSANSSETSRPTASPCTTAEAVSPYEMSPSAAVSDAGIADNATAASATPSRLPVRPRSTTCST